MWIKLEQTRALLPAHAGRRAAIDPPKDARLRRLLRRKYTIMEKRERSVPASPSAPAAASPC